MTSVTQTCRDVSELAPNAQLAIRAFFYECSKAGINVFVTETYRSQGRQNYLYEQGRSRSGQVVTWTKSSRHTSRLAWDIAVCPPQSLYDVATLVRAGGIARKLGITWGGDWKANIDRPHFEVNANWTLPKSYDINVIKGVKVPSTSAGKVVLTVADDNNKEVKAMTNVWNPGSPAITTETVELLKQAVKDGYIKQTHVDDLESGKMTTDRLVGLFATIMHRRDKAAK